MNIFPLPEFVFAIIPSFLDETDPSGILLRQFAGSVIFRHKRGNINFENGIVISFDNSPDIVQYNKELKPKYIAWTDNQERLHSDDGPAVIIYDNHYNIKMKIWMTHGLFANNNQHPNVIEYYPNGNILHKVWCERKSLTTNDLNSKNSIWMYIYQHREGSPAQITYYIDGSLHKEIHFLHGLTHNINTNEPSIITYIRNGEYSKRWFINGNLHRAQIYLPSIVDYYKSKNVKRETYFNGGIMKEILYNELGQIIMIYINGLPQYIVTE